MNSLEARETVIKKIISVSEISIISENLRSQGKKIVHCHGVFDLVHPGHLIHLEEAKGLGDVLIVSVTSEPFVNKGPGRPYFSDELRLKFLASLQYVDYVVLSEFPTATQIIGVIRPDIYSKGSEYSDANNDVTGKIDEEVNAVEEFGGTVHYTEGQVFSSTRLINNNLNVFSDMTKKYLIDFFKKNSLNDIRKYVDDMKKLKVLVVGDAIIDEYAFCSVQGLMSKDYGFSTLFEKEEKYLGGTLAIARHIASFCENVTICSIIGDEQHIHSQILNELGNKMRIDLIKNNTKSIIKKRYLARRGIRKEYDKLFSINNLGESSAINEEKRYEFYNKLNENITEYDLVVLADYGHGLLDSKAMEIIQSKAAFLALNVQTNSSNYGTNLITKYNRADTFTLDEKELKLACASNLEQVDSMLKKIHAHLGKGRGWLTRGSNGAVGIDADSKIATCPAFTLSVQDTVGAGDAFFAMASLSSGVGAPHEVGTLLGNIAGAVAANIIGNSRGIEKAEVLKFVSTVLNF